MAAEATAVQTDDKMSRVAARDVAREFMMRYYLLRFASTSRLVVH